MVSTHWISPSALRKVCQGGQKVPESHNGVNVADEKKVLVTLFSKVVWIKQVHLTVVIYADFGKLLYQMLVSSTKIIIFVAS